MNWFIFNWSDWRRYRFSLFIFIAATLLLLYCTSDEVTMSGNESSRLALIESLGDRGVFQIDESIFKTVDKGRIDGNFYSDKPMLYSLYLTGIYSVCRLFGMDFAHSYHDVIYLLNLFGGTLFAGLIMILFYRRLRWEDRGGRTSAALLSAGGIFSTWLFSYCGIINNHVPAAFFVLLLYLLTERWRHAPESWHPPVIGLCAGLILSLDIPTGFFFTLAAGLYLLLNSGNRRALVIAAMAVGFAIPVGLIALVGLIVYGSPLPVYMVQGAYDFAGNIHASGMAGLNKPEYPRYLYCFDLLFGVRGFFSYMPALLLIVPALWSARRRMNNTKPFFLSAVLACMLFYAMMTGDYGGWAYGFRFYIPLIPLLWLWIAEWLMDRSSRGWRTLFVILAVVGIITSSVGAYNPWTACKVHGRTMLFNTFAMNNYCAAYEYAPDSAWFKTVESMFDQQQIRSYMLLAFSNMQKLDTQKFRDWPPVLQHRPGVTRQFLNSLLPSWEGLKNTLLGAAFAWFSLLSAARIAPWLLGRRRLWLCPIEAITLIAPPALVLCLAAVMVSNWCGGKLQSWTFAATAVAFYVILRWLLRDYRLIMRPIQWHQWSTMTILLCLPLSLLLLLLATTLQTPPWSGDVLIYHLYTPLRWLQEQSIFTVPTVFGDSAAAYAPRNWFILSAACLRLLPGDAVMELATITFLGLTAAAAALLVRECGGNSTTAKITGGIVFLTPLLVEYSMLEQPDLAVVALLLTGLYWMLKAQARQNRGMSIMAAMCCGLAVGMKVVVLPWIALPMAIILGRELLRRRLVNALLAAGVFLLSGGGWYVYNWIVYGNPLFPLQIQLGGWVIFPGVYNRIAVHASEFHAADLSALAATVWKEYGPVTTVMMLAGWLGWGFAAWHDHYHRRRLLLIGGLAWLWLAVYIWLIPHNLQTRFLFPSLLLGLCGLCLWLGRLHRPWLLYAVAAVNCVCCMSFCIKRTCLLTNGCQVFSIFLTILLGFAVLALIFAWQSRIRRGQNIALLALIVILLIAITAACNHSVGLRGNFYQRLTGWEWLNRFNIPSQPPERIAYTGFNRPYLLVGTNLDNRVVYANIQGKNTDDFHSFWQRRPQLYNTYKPGLYRDQPDYNAWIGNLKELHVKQLVITRLSAAERTYLDGDAEGWPLPESRWTLEHPDVFVLEFSSPSVRIYRFHKP